MIPKINDPWPRGLEAMSCIVSGYELYQVIWFEPDLIYFCTYYKILYEFAATPNPTT